jgi:hypothetical protein
MRISDLKKYFTNKLVYSERTETDLYLTDGKVFFKLAFVPNDFRYRTCAEEALTPFAPYEMHTPTCIYYDGTQDTAREAMGSFVQHWNDLEKKATEATYAPTNFLYEGWRDTHRKFIGKDETIPDLWVPCRYLKLIEQKHDHLPYYIWERVENMFRVCAFHGDTLAYILHSETAIDEKGKEKL